MSRPYSWRRLIGLGLALVGLVACASDPDDSGATSAISSPLTTSPGVTTSDGSTTTPSTTAATAEVARPVVLIDVANQPGSGEFAGAVGDVDEQTCTVAGERWTSAGSVSNSTDSAADYRVYVSFLDPGGETLALIERDIDGVAAGESQRWSVGFDTSIADLRCVLRVERRAIE